MNRRYIFMGFGGLVIVLVLGVGIGALWLNSFIHSDSFRQEMQTRASQSAGGPVEIQKINLSIFSGVELEGLGAKLTTEQGTIVTQVQSVRCSYSLGALLERHLKIDALTLVHPEITLTQQPPSAMPKPAAAPQDSGKDAGAKVPPFQVTLDSAKITDGHLLVKDSTGAVKADVQGIKSTADSSGYFDGKDVTGSINIDSVALPENLTITDISTSFTYNNGAVEAKPFKATAFSGTITGEYKLDPSGPSLLSIHADQIDMLQVGQAANPTSPTKLSGLLNLQSIWHGVETARLTGEGDAQITGAKLEGVTILNELSTALHLPALNDPDISKITTHFTVADGTTHFDQLVIEATTFRMTGSGDIDPKGNLSADMVMTLNPDSMKLIPGIAATAFTKLPDGSGSIKYHLSGTAANPESDFMTKAFIHGSKVQKTISNTFNNLFK
jgi:uncharacterized protein involved in outer membrane biogenesis